MKTQTTCAIALTLLIIGYSSASAFNTAPTVPTSSLPPEVTESAPSPALAQNNFPVVVSTGDGDTLRINRSGQTVTIRLACIDSPESSQPGGSEAAARLSTLLPPGQSVYVRPVNIDRYGREVAEIYLGNQSVNLLLVREGYAVVYDEYLNGCAETQNQYLQAELEAQNARLNFWAQSNPTMPWDWRGGQSQPAPVASPAPRPLQPTQPTQPTTAFPACVRSDCDCGDFRTQAEAQRVLNAFPGDPHRLDGDSDGIACESLP